MRNLRIRQVHGIHLLLLAAWLLGACAPASQATPSPTTSPSPHTSPTPAHRIRSETSLIPGKTSGEWVVIGLAQTGADPVANPQVRIVLSNRSGAEIDRRTIELPLDIFPAGSGWPFRETFSASAAPASVEAFLIGDAASVDPVPPASAEITRIFLDAQGSTIALGRLTVDNLDVVEILAVRLLGRDSDGTMVDVLEADPARTVDFASPSLPFLARVPSSSEAVTWEGFPIIRTGIDLPPYLEPSSSGGAVDDQGNHLFTTFLDNFGDEPLWVRATGVIAQGGRWLAADTVKVPVPLAPRQRTALTLLIPKVPLETDETSGDLEWIIFTDGMYAGASPIRLVAEVVGYEPVGSSLLLRVRVQAPETEGTLAAAVSALLRPETGSLASAAWSSATDLHPGESVVLVLALPLPAGFDLAASALDVSGWGLPAPP